MARIEILTVQVHFGDCDPAAIAHYPNFFRWCDAASRNFFDKCGIPSWRELEKSDGIVGTPLVEANSRFLRPASYGDQLEIRTSVARWDRKVFVHKHVIVCNDQVLAECEEKRVFASRDAQTGRLHAVLVPPGIRAQCE